MTTLSRHWQCLVEQSARLETVLRTGNRVPGYRAVPELCCRYYNILQSVMRMRLRWTHVTSYICVVMMSLSKRKCSVDSGDHTDSFFSFFGGEGAVDPQHLFYLWDLRKNDLINLKQPTSITHTHIAHTLWYYRKLNTAEMHQNAKVLTLILGKKHCPDPDVEQEHHTHSTLTFLIFLSSLLPMK